MDHHRTLQQAIDAKALADRLYMHYALALAGFLSVAGLALVILGIGDHLDIVIAGRGDLEARFVNASPGVALWLIGAFIFWWSRPRKVVGNFKTETVSAPEPQHEAKSTLGPLLVKHLGTSPTTGEMIDVFNGRYGAYITDGQEHFELPAHMNPNNVRLEMALSVFERKRTVRSELQHEWLMESDSRVLLDLDANPFSGRSMLVVQVGNRAPLLGDGVRQCAIPSGVDPKSLTRYDAIDLLLSEKSEPYKPPRLDAPQSSALPPVPPRASPPAGRKPVITERTEIGFELHQSAPRRRDDDSGEA